ncbi:hypothetical protein ACFLU6_04905 [Acidobacteriota bacterium]
MAWGNVELQIEALQGKTDFWTVELSPMGLTFHSDESGESFEFPRSEISGRLRLQRPLLPGPALLVAELDVKTVFQLGSDEEKQLRHWLGPPNVEDLKDALARRSLCCLPAGLLFLVLSFVLPCGIITGTKPLPLDPIAFVFGIFLVGLAGLMRIHPRKELFLIDSTWLFLLSMLLVLDIAFGATYWWMLLLSCNLILIASGLRQYRHFSD